MPRALLTSVALLLSASSGAADLLYVSSYNGKVTTLNQTSSVGSDHPPAMGIVATSGGCGNQPTWLTLDHANALLYCVDEGFDTGGGLSSYRTNDDGTLTALNRVKTKASPVNAIFFGKHGLSMAHYDNAFSTWDISNPSKLKNVQTDVFTDKPSSPSSDGPHPHEAVLDPTAKYIVIPDLGNDEIRVYSVDSTTLKGKALASVKVPAGSGPRHAAFASKGGRIFLYMLTEMSNTLYGFEVTYDSSIHFKQIFSQGVHGKGTTNKNGATGSELVVSADNNFLVASSRTESNFDIPAFGGSGTIKSDPLISYSIGDDGQINFLQETAAGGKEPRQFSMNKAGTRVAVGLQTDSRVVVIERNPTSGRLGKFVSYANVAGNITSIIFNE